MKLKFLLQLPAAALLVFCLSSCDGGGGDGGGGDDAGTGFNDAPLSDRYNIAELLADPTGTPEMPVSLVADDRFEYVPDSETLSDNNITIPRSSDVDTNWLIVATSAGTISIENLNYGYLNGFTGLLNFSNQTNFDEGLDALKDSAADTPGLSFNNVNYARIIGDSGFFKSVGNAIKAGENPEDLINELVGISALSPDDTILVVNALRNLGYVVLENDDVGGLPGGDVQVTTATTPELTQLILPINGIALLSNRFFRHPKITSNNEQLATNGTIEGEFELVDRYSSLFIVYDGEALITISPPTGIRVPAEPVSIDAQANGTFTLQLNGLGSPDPNP